MTRTTRRTFCLGFTALGGCGQAEPIKPPPTDEELASAQPDEEVTGEGFAFGSADERGVWLGLKVENVQLAASPSRCSSTQARRAFAAGRRW